MTSHFASMSKADMLLGSIEDPPTGCAYSFRGDVERAERPSGRAARIGSMVHKLAELYVKGHDDGAFPKQVSMEEKEPGEGAEALTLFLGPLRTWLDQWKGGKCEIGLRFDAEADETTEGPRRGEPGYSDHGPMVLPGTLDLVRVQSGTMFIADLKTGKRENTHREQLLAQAVAMSRHPMFRAMSVRNIFIGFAMVRKTKSPEPCWEALDADALDEAAGRIRRALRLLPTSEPKTGDYCWRCDARQSCPAWAGERVA